MCDEERIALAMNGWTLECESPLEISHDDSESYATGVAAQIVIDYLRDNTNERTN